MPNECGCKCGQAHGACTTEFQYAVKLVCGEVVFDPEGNPTVVAPGRYWTAINIHNPDKCKDAHFRGKVAVASQNSQGPVSQYYGPVALSPDAAFEIDCPQVMAVVQTLFPNRVKFAKGYVVIESDIELDVVAVYTGAQTACGPLTTFHTERVQPRCVPVCEDLVLPLHTGVADWQTISPAPAGPVAIVNPVASQWATPPFGVSWVSQNSTDGNPGGAPILHKYELCFELCSGYTVPATFPIQVLGDGGPTQFYLNNNLVGSASGWTALATLNVNPNFLHAGRNCFRVEVPNGGANPNPTGFAMAGILRVARGKCPCAPLRIVATSQGKAATATLFAQGDISTTVD